MSEKLIEKLNIGGNSFVISDSAAIKLINIGDKAHLPVEGVVDLDLKDMVVTSGEVVNLEEDLVESEVLYSAFYNGSTVTWVKGNVELLEAGMTTYDRETQPDDTVKMVESGTLTEIEDNSDSLAINDNPDSHYWFGKSERFISDDIVKEKTTPAGTYLKLTIANQEEPVYIDVNDIAGTLDYDTLINSPIFKGSGTGFSKGEQLNKNNLAVQTFVIEGVSGDLYKVKVVEDEEFYDGEYRHNRVIIYNKDNEVIYLTASLENITEDDYGNAVIVEGSEGNLDYSYNATYTEFYINNNSISDIPSDPDVFACAENTNTIQVNPDYKEFFDSLGGKDSAIELETREEYEALVASGNIENDTTYYIKTAENKSAVIDDTEASTTKTYSSSKILAEIDARCTQANWEEEDNGSPSFILNKPLVALKSDIVKPDWNAEEGDASEILNKPNVVTLEEYLQPDWNEEDSDSKAFIANKPNVITVEEYLQADWEETDSESIGYIKNKPDLTDLPKYIKLNEDDELIIKSSSMNLSNEDIEMDRKTYISGNSLDLTVGTVSRSLDGISDPEKQSVTILSSLETGSFGTKTAKIEVIADHKNGGTNVNILADNIDLTGLAKINNLEIAVIKYLTKAEWDEVLANNEGQAPQDNVLYYVEDANPTYGTVSFVSVIPLTTSINFSEEL